MRFRSEPSQMSVYRSLIIVSLFEVLQCIWYQLYILNKYWLAQSGVRVLIIVNMYSYPETPR